MSATPRHELVSRARFCDEVAAGQRRAIWIVSLMVLFLLLVLYGFALAEIGMNRAGVAKDSPLRLLLVGSLLPAGLAGVGFLVWALQHPRLNCPRCSQSLVPRSQRAVVTGKCGSCAAPVFDDELPELAEPPVVADAVLVSRSELAAAERVSQRRSLRAALPWACAGALLLLAGGLAGPWLRESFGYRLGEIWEPFLAPVLLFPAIPVGLWSLAVYGRGLQPVLKCPICEHPLSANDSAVVTGNCPNCGDRAVQDPTCGLASRAEAEANMRWSVVEFRTLAKLRTNRLWIGCFIGGALAAVWSIPFLVLLDLDGASSDSIFAVTAYFICMAGLPLIQCGGVLFWHRHSARDLRCPCCARGLLGLHGLVISSRRCYHCGSVVLRPARDGESRGQGYGLGSDRLAARRYVRRQTAR